MNKKTTLIIILVIIALAAFIVTDYVIAPKIEKEKQAKIEAQKDPLTHDFSEVLEYKHKYMGAAGNLVNLNYALPLDIPFVVKLDSENLGLTINYHETMWHVGESKVKTALIYNATANFALIDNLESITFNFSGEGYTTTREQIAELYDVSLKELQDVETWKEKVQLELNDPDYVKTTWETAFTKSTQESDENQE